MMIRKWTCVLLIAIAACGGHVSSRPPRPPISDQTRRVTPVDWASGKPNKVAWPKSLSRRQIVVTGGGEHEQNYIWYFANGTQLVALYRTATDGDLQEAIAQFKAELKEAMSAGVADKRLWAILGTGPIPIPGGPGPGGEPVPDWLLELVTRIAWEFDLNALDVKLPKEMQNLEQQRQ